MFVAPASVAPSRKVGRPRLRDASSWYTDREDGVTLTIARRTERAMGGWAFLTFDGADEADAEAQYEAYCIDGYQRSAQRGRARENYGIKGRL
jgi:hypothetical protein